MFTAAVRKVCTEYGVEHFLKAMSKMMAKSIRTYWTFCHKHFRDAALTRATFLQDASLEELIQDFREKTGLVVPADPDEAISWFGRLDRAAFGSNRSIQSLCCAHWGTWWLYEFHCVVLNKALHLNSLPAFAPAL